MPTDGVKRLLRRKKEQTLSEGSRRRRTLHGITKATAECNRHMHRLLHSASRFGMLDALQDEAAPSDWRNWARPQHGCTTVAARAYRRAHCAGVLLLVKEQRAAALTRMPVHVWCMHHVLTSVPFTAGAQRQQMIGYYASATADTA